MLLRTLEENVISLLTLKISVNLLANDSRCAIILDCGKAGFMKNKSSLIFYILINIVISAATTLTVMWLWERAHPRPDPVEMASLLSSASANQDCEVVIPQIEQEQEPIHTTEPTLSFISSTESTIEIYAIVGAGNLEAEYVEIRNQGEDPADLTGWQLSDQDGQTFTFPALILNSGGAIKVISTKGTNTVIELYWQSDVPIWQSGETASLLDADGELITTYSIP